MMEVLIAWLWPILVGAGAWWLSSKVKGRNAQKSLRFAALGFWLLLLPLIWLPLPFFLNFWIVRMIPSVLCFLASGNSMLKEMRAQQRGEYTERAL